MDHDFASRSIDQRELVRKIQSALSAGALGESTMLLLLEVIVHLRGAPAHRSNSWLSRGCRPCLWTRCART
jgi:hypothetical protein|eukprot:COSAG02_NODE_11175_length_1776_cov_2.087657_1_plen_71_part_00